MPATMRRKGFTLIELLIVIAIIGIIATFAVFAVGSARESARDSRRISDVKQIRTSLDLYAVKNGGYPEETSIVLGNVATASCLAETGFHGKTPAQGSTDTACSAVQGTMYMSQVPKNPLPGGADYVYSGLTCGGGVCKDFRISYTIERGVSDLPAGAQVACAESMSGCGG